MTMANIVAKLRGLLKRPRGRAGLVAAILILPYVVRSLARGSSTPVGGESIWMQWGIGLSMVAGGVIVIGLVLLIGLVIYVVVRWIRTGKGPEFLDE
ncbi:hypothetical protein LCGC14_1499790 [marine sediment metagenome]|uniref:Uncharacterized protein n=1 Tax=marine sediment metagenome TaxID=412755 RepID=A0A0F9J4D4_9ZZZZ